MATAYIWIISQLEAYPKQDGKQDVVFTIHWRRQATDGIHTSDIYGSQSITLNPDKPFTPYINLTQAEIEGWLMDTIGADKIAEMDAALDTQIEYQINPPILKPPLPWAAE